MNRLIAFAIILMSASPLTQAAPQSESRGKVFGDFYNVSSEPTGWYGYLGVNLGVVDSETQLKHEKDAGGSQFDIRALSSYYSETTPWLLDLGLGMQNSHIGKGQLDRNVAAGYVELSSRYRFAQGWQFGPVGKIFVVGDSDFFIDSEAPVTFLGAALNYEFPWLVENPVRLGARILTDLNVDNRQVMMGMLDFQIGMPFTGAPKVKVISRSKTHPVKPVAEKAPEVKEVVISSIDEIVNRELKDIPLTEQSFRYSKGRVAPEERVQFFLSRLGELLSKEPDLFKTVKILGHTDPFKKPLIREILANSRAQSVAKSISSAGLSIDKIQAQGFSSLQSLNEDSYSKSRVEIIFTGVTDEARLQEIIQQAL